MKTKYGVEMLNTLTEDSPGPEWEYDGSDVHLASGVRTFFWTRPAKNVVSDVAYTLTERPPKGDGWSLRGHANLNKTTRFYWERMRYVEQRALRSSSGV